MTGLTHEQKDIILASASMSRARLLSNAGLTFETQPADLDEKPIKDSCKSSGVSAIDTATKLAEQKALTVSHMNPTALVIGADQILDLDGTWFDKPKDLNHARQHLLSLRGRTHVLATAITLARDGRCIWHDQIAPSLTMRPFSDAFLERYLDTCGDAILSSVGAYHLEGSGAHLFSRIDGDFFSILGLPLISLLAILRELGAVQQ